MPGSYTKKNNRLGGNTEPKDILKCQNALLLATGVSVVRVAIINAGLFYDKDKDLLKELF